MKTQHPIQAGGLYLDHKGQWQSAQLVTDGRDLVEIGQGATSDEPNIPKCQVLGLNADLGIEPPLIAEELANSYNLSVVSDMRQSDMAFGGRGAPLTPFYLHALARYHEARTPLVFLDLGKVASVTWVDPSIENPENPAALMAFHAGPAMAPLSELYRQRPDGVFQSGKVEDGALELFLQDPYFRRIAPKWLEPDSFANMLELVFELSDADAEATLCGMIATAIILADEHFPKPPSCFVVYGRGSDHKYLMNIVKSGLDVPVINAAGWGMSAATLKAQSTAYLAVRALNGLPTTAPTTTGVKAAIGGASMSHPR